MQTEYAVYMTCIKFVWNISVHVNKVIERSCGRWARLYFHLIDDQSVSLLAFWPAF